MPLSLSLSRCTQPSIFFVCHVVCPTVEAFAQVTSDKKLPDNSNYQGPQTLRVRVPSIAETTVAICQVLTGCWEMAPNIQLRGTHAHATPTEFVLSRCVSDKPRAVTQSKNRNHKQEARGLNIDTTLGLCPQTKIFRPTSPTNSFSQECVPSSHFTRHATTRPTKKNNVRQDDFTSAAKVAQNNFSTLAQGRGTKTFTSASLKQLFHLLTYPSHLQPVTEPQTDNGLARPKEQTHARTTTRCLKKDSEDQRS